MFCVRTTKPESLLSNLVELIRHVRAYSTPQTVARRITCPGVIRGERGREGAKRPTLRDFHQPKTPQPNRSLPHTHTHTRAVVLIFILLNVPGEQKHTESQGAVLCFEVKSNLTYRTQRYKSLIGHRCREDLGFSMILTWLQAHMQQITPQ